MVFYEFAHAESKSLHIAAMAYLYYAGRFYPEAPCWPDRKSFWSVRIQMLSFVEASRRVLKNYVAA
jgi:hypothetical protein